MNLSALHKINYGMFIVSSKLGEKLNGQIANTVFQVTSEPPAIAVCINKQNLTYEYIKQSGVFSVSVLTKDTPMEFIGRFGFRSGKDFDKFDGIKFKTGVTGSPIVEENASAYFEAEVINSMDSGSHVLFIGKIVGSEIISDMEPMTYAYYHTVKRGKSPKNAPTYIQEEKTMEPAKENSKNYKCTVCGYVYTPDKGDPESGIEPGTLFEEIPESWVCPVCKAPKSVFVPL